jgi:hypothetical protein
VNARKGSFWALLDGLGGILGRRLALAGWWQVRKVVSECPYQIFGT